MCGGCMCMCMCGELIYIVRKVTNKVMVFAM